MGDAPGHLVVPPHFRPTDRKIQLGIEERADGGLVLRNAAGKPKKARESRVSVVTVEVRPDGVTVLSPGVLKDDRRDWSVERIVEVRAARPAGVCLTVREVGGGGRSERWSRVRLPVMDAEKQQGEPSELMSLASPWLAGEVARVLRRPALADAYVAGPGWVDAAVEDAGRHGQLVYGVSAPGEEAEAPPAVDAEGAGARLEVPPREARWKGMGIMVVFLAVLWLVGVGLCAGVIGRGVMIPAEFFAVVAGVLAVYSVVGEILDARQHVVMTTPEAGVVEVDVRGLVRHRRWRLTRENTRAVYLAAGRRNPNLKVSRESGKDKVLLSGLDRAVVRSAATLIERHLQLEPSDPTAVAAVSVSAAVAVPTPAVPVTPVAAPAGPGPVGWVVEEGGDGPGTWIVTRPVAGAGEKVGTAGCLVAVVAAAVGAAMFFPGRGPVPGVGGVIVGGFGFLMLMSRIERALGPATVRFDGAAVHVARRGVFGRVQKRIDVWSIERVIIGSVIAGEGKNPTANLQLRLRDGTHHDALGSAPEPDVRWLARKLASSLNMTEDVGSAAGVVGGSQM